MNLRRYVPVGLAAMALFGAVVWPMLGGKVYVGDDLKTFHLPTRAYYAEQLAAGEPTAWWPSACCGVDLHAEGQVGMLHPWHLVLYRCLPLSAAFNLEFLTGYVVAFAGMGLFLARKGLPGDAAVFGATVFTFSGFNLLHFMHVNFIAVVAQLPWLLLAIDASLAAPGGRNAAGARLAVALLTASQLLLGYPQAVWLSLVAEGVYVVTVRRVMARGWGGGGGGEGARFVDGVCATGADVGGVEALRAGEPDSGVPRARVDAPDQSDSTRGAVFVQRPRVRPRPPPHRGRGARTRGVCRGRGPRADGLAHRP